MRNPATVVAAVIALAIAIVLSMPGMFEPGWEQDEGVLLVYPERILEGDVPNRDFESLYGPGNLYVLAGIYKVAGTSVSVERTVGLLYKLAIVMALFALGRRRGLVAACGAGLIAALGMATIHGSPFSWLGGLALSLWGLYLLCSKELSVRRAFTAGILFGLAAWFRWDLGPAIVLVTAVAAIGKRRVLGPLLAGMAMGAIGYVVHLVLAGPGNVVTGMILDPILHIGPGRRLPLPPSDRRGMAMLILLGVAVVFLFVRGFQANRLDHADRSHLMLAVFALGLVPQALQRADSIHIMYAACVPLALCVPAVAFFQRPGRLGSVLMQILIAAAIVAIAFEPVPNQTEAPATVTGEGRSFPLPSASVAADAQRIIDAARSYSEPGDLLFIGSTDLRRTNYNDTYMYFLLHDLKPASYFLELNPGSANRGTRLANDIEHADLLILTDRFNNWSEPNASVSYGSDVANRAVSSRFCLQTRSGSYELLLRCSGH